MSNEKLLPKNQQTNPSFPIILYYLHARILEIWHLFVFVCFFIVFIIYLFTLAMISIYLEQLFILNRALKCICIVQSFFMLFSISSWVPSIICNHIHFPDARLKLIMIRSISFFLLRSIEQIVIFRILPAFVSLNKLIS